MWIKCLNISLGYQQTSRTCFIIVICLCTLLNFLFPYALYFCTDPSLRLKISISISINILSLLILHVTILKYSEEPEMRLIQVTQLLNYVGVAGTRSGIWMVDPLIWYMELLRRAWLTGKNGGLFVNWYLKKKQPGIADTMNCISFCKVCIRYYMTIF